MAVVLLAAAPAWAHHSFAAEFDQHLGADHVAGAHQRQRRHHQPQRPARAHDRPQFRRQTVGNHFEMKKHPRLITREEKFEQ